MNLFGVLGNARGQRSLASGAAPSRRVKRLPAERLAAARLAGILLLLDDASPTAVRRQLDGADPQHVSAARQPRHAREPRIAPVPEVLESDVPEPEVPGAGRHRRPGVQAAVIPTPVIAAHEMPAYEISGTGRHRRPGVSAAVDCAHPIPASVLSRPAVPGAGHHRRAGVRAFMALRAVRVAPPRVVLLGLLVLLVAFAAVLGVRGSAALESAQPPADAAISHSATVIVPGTR